MPSAVAARFEAFDEHIVSHAERATALERFAETPTGREKPSRFWKANIEQLDIDALDAAPGRSSFAVSGAPARVTVVDFATARQQHGALFSRAFGKAVRAHHKWAHLGHAFAHDGLFVHIPAGVAADEVKLDVSLIGASAFAYIVVLAEAGSRATLLERLTGDVRFAVLTVEIVAEENAAVTYASLQDAGNSSTVYATRAAAPAKDATVAFACADLGASLCVGDIAVTMESHGSTAGITSLFFPGSTQHVDVVSSTDHLIGDTTSETIVKSAATASGQARYLGNIRIAAHAQNSNASLRDDALLLSKRAHIDSVPALEIAANEVKAYHGATVGAIDEEALFYMTSRGIERAQAERMIALGFFEPAVDRFPTEALREELRAILQGKIEASA